MTRDARIVSVRTRGQHLWASAELLESISALGLGDADGFRAALERARRVPGGRGEHGLLMLPDGERRLRLRPARHGGLLGRLFAGRYLSPRRAPRELALWLRLRDEGIPLPIPVAAIATRRGGFWECHFAALEREGARDGRAWLASNPSPGELRRAAVAFARALRKLHDAGVVHGDLNLGNILIEQDGGALGCLFVDLDHARRPIPVSPRDRLAELARIGRSLEKSGMASLATGRLLARVLGAYCGGDRGLRRALLASRRREQRRLIRHRIGWAARSALARGLFGGSLAALALTLVPRLALLLALIALGCEPRDRTTAPDASAITSRRATWSMLAVGDTGHVADWTAFIEGQLAVAVGMTREARRNPVDALVLLGDNFYDDGLAEGEVVARVRGNLVRPYCHFLALSGPRSAEVASACPLTAADRRPVPILAVLGNHDRERPGSVELERKAIPEFLPDWRMAEGLAGVVELHPGISVVLFESELEVDDRPAGRAALIRAIREARGPWRILAVHRPLASDDRGRPTDDGYPAWLRAALAEAGRPVQLVLSGHHHSLQAFALREPMPLLQIGAGSGSRTEPPLATGHPDLRFSALELGFARVDLVGDANDERLAVSLFTVPPWPALVRLLGQRLRSRLEVDLEGRVELPDDVPSTSHPDA